MAVTQTKIYNALDLLKKDSWVSRAKLVTKLGTEDLRAVRHLRGYGYEIQCRKTRNGYEYKRVND